MIFEHTVVVFAGLSVSLNQSLYGVSQVAYSIIDTRPEKKMVAWCLHHNVQLLAYGYVAFCVIFPSHIHLLLPLIIP